MFYNRGYLHVSVSIFWVRFRASLGKKCHLDSMDFKILSNLKYHSLPEQALHGIYQGIFYIFRLDNKRLKVVIDSFVVHSLSCIQIFATLWTEARLSCPFSPTVCPNSYPLSQWCHPTISSSGIPFFFCPQSFPTSGSSPRSQLFTSNGQIMGALASASVLPMNSQSWFPLGLTGLTSFQSMGLSRIFSSSTIRKHQFFSIQSSLWSNSHVYTWLLEKPQLWLDEPLLAK